MFVYHVSWVSLLGGKFLHILSARPLVTNPGKKMNMMKASNLQNDLCSKKKQGSQLASCGAVFVLVSMWLPQQHLVSIWTPDGIHVETTWCPVETT